ncbi:MAG: hypothetical protein LBG67_00895 [Campylobacteraceae bacterium]|nr:hypothetical protein [Campylobacteraceae bacterium]
MHRFLLINNNPAVSKLVETSFQQLGIELTQISSYNSLVLERYIGIIIDSQMYDKGYIEDLIALSDLPSLIYIKNADEISPEGVKYSIKKPFLPTDFIRFIDDIIKENRNLNYLDTRPKKSIFETLQDSTEKNPTNKILKNDELEEIQNIMFDAMFNEKLEPKSDDIETFKNYDEIEKQNRFFLDDVLSLNELDEKEMQIAFNNELDSQKISFEVVKDELKHSIEHSVTSLAMQSSVLRETLKGLKMNIVITFEDK